SRLPVSDRRRGREDQRAEEGKILSLPAKRLPGEHAISRGERHRAQKVSVVSGTKCEVEVAAEERLDGHSRHVPASAGELITLHSWAASSRGAVSMSKGEATEMPATNRRGAPMPRR